MKKEQHISRKKFDGYNLYRIHDIVNGKLTNLRAVKQVGDEYELLLDLSAEEQAFIYDDADIYLYAGSSEEEIKNLLFNHECDVEQNILNIMEMTALIDIESLQARTIAGHTYVLSLNEDDVDVPSITYAFGAEDGRIGFYGPIPQEQNLETLMLELIEHPYNSDKKEPIYQIGPSEYVVITEYKNTIITVPILLHQGDDGELGWVSDVDYLRYYTVDENNHAEMITKPDLILTNDEETHRFLEETTKEATNKIMERI